MPFPGGALSRPTRLSANAGSSSSAKHLTSPVSWWRRWTSSSSGSPQLGVGRSGGPGGALWKARKAQTSPPTQLSAPPTGRATAAEQVPRGASTKRRACWGGWPLQGRAVSVCQRSEITHSKLGRAVVPYLNATERRKYLLHVREGLLYDATGKLFDTGESAALYVMDEQGRLYAAPFTAADNLHHSSFLAGGPVAGAGMMQVKDGRLVAINARSGHYQPSEEVFGQVLEKLRELGVDVP